jgi:hypothetical protein
MKQVFLQRGPKERPDEIALMRVCGNLTLWLGICHYRAGWAGHRLLKNAEGRDFLSAELHETIDYSGSSGEWIDS